MSKHSLKIIIDQPQNSPAMKMMREIQDSPAAKMMREMQDSPFMKMTREMQDSPAAKMMREMQDSPAAKMMREMQDSPTAKMMREMQDSPAAKMMREIQDSPAAKMMREMQDSPAAKMMREMQDSPFMKMTREMQDSPAAKMMHEMQDSPVMKMMREIQDSPAAKMMREMQLFTIDSGRQYSEVVEESINISDEIIDNSYSHQTQPLNDQSLFLNTFFLSIYILVTHTQVPLDQLLVTLAQNFLNSALFFFLQSKYEVARTSRNGINKNDFKNSRITIKAESLYQEPKINSEIIENLEPYKFLIIVEEPDLHKSWLKVQVEINDEILEGYVLRRYTSPIK